MAFLVSGTVHLVRPSVFTGIVPHVLPHPTALVLVSGVAELLCAVALLVPRARVLGGWATFVLLLAVFPANVQMAVDAWADHRAGDAGAAYVVGTLVRLPLQLPLLWWAWRLTRDPRSAVRTGEPGDGARDQHQRAGRTGDQQRRPG